MRLKPYFCRKNLKMSKMSSLEGPREALAASLTHFNATVRAYLAPHHEIVVKRAVDAILRATADYTKAFHEAEIECQGKVVVPRYLSER